MYLMSAISIERYYVIHKPMNIKKINYTSVYLIVFACIALSVFWTSAPFFGWSHYAFEGVKTSCSIEWNEYNFSVLSYNMAIFLFVVVVPLIGILFADYNILIVVSNL
jgi:hypothetical protein